MTFLKEHLKSRGMNPDLYSVSYDEDEKLVTILLYTMDGKLGGFQQYNPMSTDKKTNNPRQSRYFTYLTNKTAIFGLETLDNTKDTIYVVEGTFKAANLHRLGYNAIAALTSTPKGLKDWLYIMSKNFKMIAIGDADEAGKKLINLVGNGFQSPIDIDEMNDDDIIELLRSKDC